MKLTFLTHGNRYSWTKMKRQRSMSQIKTQDKTTARDLSKMEINDMPDREF